MADLNEGFFTLTSGYLFPEISRRVANWQKEHKGEEVLKLGIGNTTEPLTPYIAKAMKDKISQLEDVKTYTGYGDEQGDMMLRKALKDFYKREYDVEFDDTEFFVSDGAKSDAANIQYIFSNKCKIAVQDPSYPVYVDSNVASGRSSGYDESRQQYKDLYYMECREDNNFIPLPPKEKVDLIYLCFPNNPTGACATYEDLEKFIEYAKREKALIIYDAAYCDYITEKDKYPRTIYQVKGAKEVAIEINSFSKNAGFTGVRLGWDVVPKMLVVSNKENDSIYKIWNRRQCTFFNGASNISQAGGIAALSLQGRAECLSLVSYYLENARIIKDGLTEAGCVCYGGVNSPYVWLKCKKGMKSWEFFDYVLDKAHVVITPGAGFGLSGNDFVRVSAYGHRENIIKAVKAIKEIL